MPNGWKARLSSRQTKYGLNTALYVLAALAIAVFINLIANHFVKQVDLTANQRFSLSQQTVKILDELQQDVELLYFDRQLNFDQATDLLEQYKVQSRRVRVTYVDPDREPVKATQYNVKTYGLVVVVSGGRSEQSKGIREEDVTNAIIKVLKGGPKLIYFLTGHGERDIESTERIGYSEAKKALDESNYQAKTLSLLEESPQVPEDASVLVVAGPQKDLLDPEIEAIRQFIQKGGRVFFMVNPQSPPKVVALLDEFGADVHTNLVVDTSGIGRLFGTDELMPLVIQYEDHPITKDMTNVATVFPFANAVIPSVNKTPGVEFQPIANTTEKSWATSEVADTISFREGKDTEGPLALMGAGVYKDPVSDNAAEGRIVVSGSQDAWVNYIVAFNGNRDLFLNAVSWLASDEDLISIRPKDPEDRPVNLTPSQMRLIFFLSLLVPLAVILSGLGVWWKRRA
ncbi:MAG: GldG family protein [Acidobacteria bacterium]|nr:GldG family protein [Acidobacteriota bacterium]